MMSNCLNIPLKDYSNNLIAKWVFDNTDTPKENFNIIIVYSRQLPTVLYF